MKLGEYNYHRIVHPIKINFACAAAIAVTTPSQNNKRSHTIIKKPFGLVKARPSYKLEKFLYHQRKCRPYYIVIFTRTKWGDELLAV